MQNSKYPALTTVANFYRFLAWFTIGFTIFLMILGVISAFVSGLHWWRLFWIPRPTIGSNIRVNRVRLFLRRYWLGNRRSANGRS